jgi:homoserine kinase type II
MAVYTSLTLEEANAWFTKSFALGELKSFKGISDGIENSNFFIDANYQGKITEYVLTIFERLQFDQLPYYLNLMLFLSNHHIKVPTPFLNRQHHILDTLKNKPAAIVSKLEGSPRLSPNEDQCAKVARMLASMHLVGKDYPAHQENLRSLPWWQSVAKEIIPFLDEAKKNLLSSEITFQTQFFSSVNYTTLPFGACHCDLFRDNVLFKDNDELSGFFDFYFAGTDKWLFDVAVTVNDWCIELSTGAFDQERLDAFLNAYQEVRPFTVAETIAWPKMLRAAALRFWISRLWDFYIPRNAQLLTPHDPSHFEKILRLRIQYAN